MGKKRRNDSGRPSDRDRDDGLERFDDDGGGGDRRAATAGSTATDRSSAGGGGGMSRAAKKRARKRARTAATAPSSSGQEDGGEEGSGKKIKMRLPLDDDDDDSGKGLVEPREDNGNKKKRRKKKKKKSKKELSNNEEGDHALDTEPAGPAKVAAAAAASKGGTTEADEYAEDDPDMEPELEALLSTLTPRQILLLDVDKEGDSEKPAASEQGGQNSDGDVAHENAEGAPGMEMQGEEDGGMLAGIDPLRLVGDLTTEHRARTLLSSLIAPSGVTVYEFYQRYWGKRPLLAVLDRDEDGDTSNEQNGKQNREQIGRQNGKRADEADRGDQEAAIRHAARLNGFLDRQLIDTMIKRNKLRYGLDLNITRYTDTTGNGLRHRVTLDPPPKKRKIKSKSGANETGDDLEYVVANPRDVWSNVDTSRCSLRLLRPHEHNDDVHSMLSLLESEFGCMVGSNAYLTPLNSQGFAPHYDDVDVFVLQLEGYKRWRVYAPMNKREALPRESSRDYTDREIEERGEEVMDEVLGPGDVLYLPRGWIHQAETVKRPSDLPRLPGKKDDHSLHLTVSAMQNWCWADFLEMLLPGALEGAAGDENTSLREGLPRNFLGYMGTMHQATDDDERGDGLPEGLKQVAEARATGEEGNSDDMDHDLDDEARKRRRTIALQERFREEARKRIARVSKRAMSMLDDACDQIGVRFLSDRLPPALLGPERSLTKDGGDTAPLHHHDASKKIWPNTLCRLARPNIARLVVEEGKAVLYHCLDNSRVYRGTPLSPMEFEVDDAPALEQLLTTVEPRWIMVKDLIHGDVEDKMGIAQALYDEGILAAVQAEAPDRSVQTG